MNTSADRAHMEIVFLGTGACIPSPAYFCTCATCESVRKDPTLRRTRASLAVVGRERVLIDASPDLARQLERERLERIERLFLTHWHWDHIAGIGELGEPSAIGGWPPIDLYAAEDATRHFDEELAYLKPQIRPHTIAVRDRVELPDAFWEVVKTHHTDGSVGFIIHAGKTVAYLLDGVVPPRATVERLAGCDLLILEATLDELDEEGWTNFSVAQAVAFWKTTNIPECVLTHYSGHSWKDKKLVAGWGPDRRERLENEHPGLRFAHDGLRIALS